ncbi:non-hydrolyzing UDP-N-acetylglucosamine 2-epimerase [Natranaerofaba carboxydovora]|uniref:non-hydrolyzing UDP-N-acetylglucosamine 2-epimerase n=1 Tax=Natranaerofaba carboxydovora TaxID=2742683 RepID=UPI0024026F11|nr:UDP-N-acetylglucosamine 2-epimerase (non-hydrolyzing) [Natranaerofaba carboxydovora]UMZ75115.1 UDP-N-acetylglucosamine 2-epimerase [Natranaerofaba carboxydovora]
MANKPLKVLSIFGTRPEAIKMAPLVKELEKEPVLESVVAVSAQHREMLSQVLGLFDITPDYNLDIMKDRQTLSDITTSVLNGLDTVIKKENPDLALVHGDTTTTFVGALSAFYNKTSVGHVEAGLRTGDRYTPFPEEMNRRLVSEISELNFAPTRGTLENLLNEGIKRDNIFVTGNTVIDAIKTSVADEYLFKNNEINCILEDPIVKNKKVIVIEAHRRENWGKPMEEICLAVKELVNKYEDFVVVFPVHPNPAVKETVDRVLKNLPRVFLISPLDMRDFHNLLNKSYLILTDSGGIQEEAPSLGVPVVVLREKTERPEALKAGTVILAGTDKEKILSTTEKLINDREYYERISKVENPYGDGKASKRIIEAIKFYFEITNKEPPEWL